MDSMAPPLESLDPPTVVRLPANGTTACAEDVRTELVFAAQQGRGIEIDASAVRSVGQAVLQLLAAAQRDATAAGYALLFSGTTPEFRDRVAGCKMNEMIGLAAGGDEA